MKCLYLTTRNLNLTGNRKTRWFIRRKPALNTFTITFTVNRPGVVGGHDVAGRSSCQLRRSMARRLRLVRCGCMWIGLLRVGPLECYGFCGHC